MGNHYYNKDGSSCYSVKTKTGGTRPVRWDLDRDSGIVPSVTTILGEEAKPALTSWLMDDCIRWAATYPHTGDCSPEEYVRRIRGMQSASVRGKAEEGDRIHSAVEDIICERPVQEKYEATASAALAVLSTQFPTITDWVPEYSFASPQGFGGRVDIHSKSTGVVIDIKTKDMSPSDTKRLYYDQNVQIAAYQKGMGFPLTVGGIIFVSRSVPGYVKYQPISASDMEKGWRIFESLLNLWYAKRSGSNASERGK